jgi:hypothetical protein
MQLVIALDLLVLRLPECFELLVLLLDSLSRNGLRKMLATSLQMITVCKAYL